jgi:hypothetical protein
MAILNRVIDSIVGVPSMRKVRNLRMDAMRDIYDPTIYNEIATRQRTRATEGLSDLAEQNALRRVASQGAAPIDPSILGGNAARAMSMATSQQASVNSAYGQVAERLAEMDEQMRLQYGDAYAQTVGLQSQQLGFRRAALANEQAMFEQERSSRRRELGTQVAVGLGSLALGALTGGVGAGAALGASAGGAGGSLLGLAGSMLGKHIASGKLTKQIDAQEAARMAGIPTRENMPSVPQRQATPITIPSGASIGGSTSAAMVTPQQQAFNPIPRSTDGSIVNYDPNALVNTLFGSQATAPSGPPQIPLVKIPDSLFQTPKVTPFSFK